MPHDALVVVLLDKPAKPCWDRPCRFPCTATCVGFDQDVIVERSIEAREITYGGNDSRRGTERRPRIIGGGRASCRHFVGCCHSAEDRYVTIPFVVGELAPYRRAVSEVM